MGTKTLADYIQDVINHIAVVEVIKGQPDERKPASRELSLVKTKLQEAQMWADRHDVIYSDSGYQG